MSEILWLALVIIIVGTLVWGIRSLPFIDERFKQVAFVVIVVALVIYGALVVYSVLVGAPPVPKR